MLNCSERAISLAFMQQPAYVNVAPSLQQSKAKVLKNISCEAFMTLSQDFLELEKNKKTSVHITIHYKKGFVKAYHRQLFQLSVHF